MSRIPAAVLVAVLILFPIACDPADGGLGDGIARLIRSFLYEPFRVPSGGMIPTLLIGDHFFVDKSAYSRRDPARGDIVVFRAARRGTEIVPADVDRSLPTEVFVKRLVGLPLDRIL